MSDSQQPPTPNKRDANSVQTPVSASVSSPRAAATTTATTAEEKKTKVRTEMSESADSEEKTIERPTEDDEDSILGDEQEVDENGNDSYPGSSDHFTTRDVSDQILLAFALAVRTSVVQTLNCTFSPDPRVEANELAIYDLLPLGSTVKINIRDYCPRLFARFPLS